MHYVPLTDQEVQLIYDTLARRMFYKPYYLRGNEDIPGGHNPYKPWMEDTMARLKPFVRKP